MIKLKLFKDVRGFDPQANSQRPLLWTIWDHIMCLHGIGSKLLFFCSFTHKNGFNEDIIQYFHVITN